MSYRCSKCRGRNRLRRKPEEYKRLPPCARCGSKMTAYPLGRNQPHYVLDRYRIYRERGPKVTCVPGRSGCNGYHFPHRRGSRWCVDNPNPPADDYVDLLAEPPF